LGSQLKDCYPQLSDVFTRSLRSGRKELNVEEEFGKTRLVTEATHVNDGMLWLMAILVELLTDHEFLLFDEIENGINPELVEFLLDKLVNARQQVLVTTHSPMILNYLDDQVARGCPIFTRRSGLWSPRVRRPAMLILVSGEGVTDMGRCIASAQCSGQEFEAGPMAWLVDQLLGARMDYSFLSVERMVFATKSRVSDVSKSLKPPTLVGRKRKQETAYFFRNARAMSQARTEARQRGG